ncbi:hypothetical protein [Phyllobacterium phragmitis]|uniref:Uncharacterized protein n=1 Tax=Phyllobacterium phragmitis TaxID=2670329 RepID=A0ABQ0H6W8_9HYPH
MLNVMERLPKFRLQTAMIFDERIATPIDVLEPIAGEFSEMTEEAVTFERQEDCSGSSTASSITGSLAERSIAT